VRTSISDWENRRTEIIDTAARLFAVGGYHRTSIEEISRAVGLKKGPIYHYISSKEELLVEIQNRVIGPLILIGNRIMKLDAPALVRLRLLSGMQLELMLERLEHIWVYEHDRRYLTGTNRSRMVRQRSEYEAIIVRLMDDLFQSERFRCVDVRLAMLQYINIHNHTYQWARSENRWSSEDLSREYCATLLAGFAENASKISGTLELDVDDFRMNYDGPTLSAIEK
jgi:TetR/AcrR family transcriptional regulator, cholesterol catabolism regulator